MPRRPIEDEFTDLSGITRQRRYQLRLARDRKCLHCCKATAEIGKVCLKCRVQMREERRQRRGCTRRYDSMSYRMEQLRKRKKNVAQVKQRKNPAPVKPNKTNENTPARTENGQ
jgi:hypothetical protein